MQEKAHVLRETGDDRSKKLITLSEEKGELAAERKELTEAIDEGSLLVERLDGVIESLQGAEGWGTWDLLGGGLITTAMKHSKIDAARDGVTRLQPQLNRFRRELADVDIEAELAIEISSFASFADYFFDGLIVDWVVQSRISESLAQLRRTRDQVLRCVARLQDSGRDNEKRWGGVEAQWRTIVEGA